MSPRWLSLALRSRRKRKPFASYSRRCGIRLIRVLIPKIFHPDFTFRGSLGPELRGHEQFAGYVDMVTGALGQYTSDILDMVEEDNKVFGKLRYHGYHRGELLGCPPTGRHVWWQGTPLFTFNDTKVRDLWVLGDVHGLIGRLKS